MTMTMMMMMTEAMATDAQPTMLFLIFFDLFRMSSSIAASAQL
ncbi:hypothetical protein DEV91_13930 [Phyllobacterium brassicacearum]|nr:hypothetical protein DEV91_13930 [Phyllobacterium brassicacearum]